MTFTYIFIDNVRAIDAQTLSILKELDLKYFPQSWSSSAWDEIIHSSKAYFIVLAKHVEEVVGFALFSVDVADSFAHLLKILVMPSMRGQKIGKGLLKESLNILSVQGVNKFFLEVEEHNLSAIKLYETLGFKIIHLKKQFYSNGASALIMNLDMTSSV